jgi:hypothetical protein
VEPNRFPFTEPRLTRLSKPERGDVVYRDATMRALAVRVRPSGSRTLSKRGERRILSFLLDRTEDHDVVHLIDLDDGVGGIQHGDDVLAGSRGLECRGEAHATVLLGLEGTNVALR